MKRNKKGVSRLQMLLEKSEGIKNVFTDAMHELAAVNKEIDQEVVAKTQRIEALQSECSTLNETRCANEKMRSKMANFLGLEDNSDKEVVSAE